MAKLKFGMIVTDARGKLGGHVLSKNRSGAYARTKVTPSNPRTAAQSAQRSRLASFSQSWSGLTPLQRAAWNGAVADWARTDIFGDSHNPSGKNLYVRLNTNILLAGGLEVTTPPAKVDVNSVGLESITYDVSGSTTTVVNSGTIDGLNLMCAATPVLSAGTSNAKNRFRILGAFADIAAFEAGFKAAFEARFGTLAVGQNIQVSLYQAYGNGQNSVRETVTLTIQA